jgi:uncharacterized protein YjbI with pentapeptide repeats
MLKWLGGRRTDYLWSGIRGLVIGIFVIAIIALPLLIWLPEKLVDGYGAYTPNGQPLSRESYTKLVDDYRRTFAQILGGAGAIYALHLLFRRTRAVEETLAATLQGQITERFTRAIEQLGATDKDGKKLLAIRCGGIYALERIARDSARDHSTVMEVLGAYVRLNSTWNEQKAAETAKALTGEIILPELPIDIQAALTVISRRKVEHDPKGMHIDLSGADLRRANLRRAHLDGADLSDAHLEDANLEGAYLNGANLFDAVLEGAVLVQTQMLGACLMNVDFTNALVYSTFLQHADLQGAKFCAGTIENTRFDGANLAGADLSSAYMLTPEQVRTARLDERTKLPFTLDTPAANTTDALVPASLTSDGKSFKVQVGVKNSGAIRTPLNGAEPGTDS